MKNWEYYKDEIKQHGFGDFAMIKNNFCVDCGDICCEECKFYSEKDNIILQCDKRKTEFLYKKHEGSIKLTRLEFELLKYYQKNDYKYITRDETNNRLSFFRGKPKRSFCSWLSNEFFEVHYPVFEKYLTELFSFIKWEDEEPVLIQDILDNCEVIEDK